MAILSSQLGGILEAAISVTGLVNGVSLGLFTLAALLPWANSIVIWLNPLTFWYWNLIWENFYGLFQMLMWYCWMRQGAFGGVLSGLSVTTWIYIGSTLYPPPAEYRRVLPLCTTTCTDIPDASCGIYDFNATTIASENSLQITQRTKYSIHVSKRFHLYISRFLHSEQQLYNNYRGDHNRIPASYCWFLLNVLSLLLTCWLLSNCYSGTVTFFCDR